MRHGALTAAVAALALLAGACSTSDASNVPSTTTTTAEPAGSGTVESGTVESGVTTSSTSVAPTPVRDHADFSEVDATIERFVAEHGLNGAGLVVLDRTEGVVHEFYDGVFDPQRVSLIASSSKMLTAGVLLRLQDQGLIDLDAPIADYVDWGASNPGITTAHLLSNNSGLVGLTTNPMFGPYLCQYLATGTIQDCAERIFTTTEDDAMVAAPGTEFRYGGGQWQVAGAVAEVVSGKPWAQLVTETYTEPCALSSLAYNNHFAQVVGPDGPFKYPDPFDGDPSVLGPTDNPNMEGGAYITAPEYARLLLMVLRGGVCDQTRVLSEAAVSQMVTSRYGSDFESGLGATAPFGGYGLGWWIDEEDPSLVEDSGAFGAVPWMDLGRGYAAYLVVEADNLTGRALANEIRPLIQGQIDDARS